MRRTRVPKGLPGALATFAILLSLSGCLGTSDDESGALPDDGWSESTERVRIDRTDFPEASDWVLIETRSRPNEAAPSLRFQATFDESPEGPASPQGPTRRHCVTVQAAGEGTASSLYGWSPSQPGGVMWDVQGSEQSLHANNSGLSFNADVLFGVPNATDDGSAFYLLAFSMMPALLPEDEVSWEIGFADTIRAKDINGSFRWRTAASGPMQCGNHPADFEDGEFLYLGATQTAWADGLEQSLAIREAGLIAAGVAADGSYDVTVDASDGTTWRASHHPTSPTPSVEMKLWWAVSPSEWTIRMQNVTHFQSRSIFGTAYMQLDGVPQAAASLLQGDPDS